MALRPFKIAIEKVALQVAKRHGILLYQMISNWPKIVGLRIAKLCNPIRLNFPFEKNIDGVLFLEVSNPGFGLELQSMEGVLLDRIATYQGFKSITRIKININPKRVKYQLEDEEKVVKEKNIIDQKTLDILADVKDEKLKDILKEIAEYI